MKRWFIAIVTLQIVFILGEALHYQSRLKQGMPILLNVVPVDPRSLFEGRYMALGYDISSWKYLAPHCVSATREVRTGDTVWVGLRPGNPNAIVSTVSLETPDREPGIVYLKGTCRNLWGSDMVMYGIERYYIPDAREKDAQALWDRMSSKRSRVTAEISVNSQGQAMIRRLRENGVPVQY